MATFDFSWRPRILVVHAKRPSYITELTHTFNMSTSENVNPLPAGCYALIPKSISAVAVPKLLDVVIVSDMLADKPARQDTLQDFQDSDKVYEFMKQRKITVVQDDFSFVRNQGLYIAFNLIENKWRMLVLRNAKLAELIEKVHPQDYRSKVIDHKAAQYHLSEFYESFLRAPASDEYIIEQWGKSGKTAEDLIRIKDLRMLNQLKFPLNDAELETLRETRNQCMHFRVTTLATYCQTVELVNRYVKDFEVRELTEAVSRIINPQVERFAQLLAETVATNLSDLAVRLAAGGSI